MCRVGGNSWEKTARLLARKKEREKWERSPLTQNRETGVRRWVTHTDVAGQKCHFHVKPSQMHRGGVRGGEGWGDTRWRQAVKGGIEGWKGVKRGRAEMRPLENKQGVRFQRQGGHRHSIVQANYQWKIITTDGSRAANLCRSTLALGNRWWNVRVLVEGVRRGCVCCPTVSHTPDVNFHKDGLICSLSGHHRLRLTGQWLRQQLHAF